LVFVGWAPFEDLSTDLDSQPSPTQATEPQTEAATNPDEPAPSITDVIRGSGEPESAEPPAQGQFQSYTHREGDEAYLPSRLEWVSLRASAELPRGGGPNDGYGILYGPDGKGSNTIRVLCTYDTKRVNRQRMENDLKYIEMQLGGLAKLYGWDWLKVRIESQAVN
jgi:hypothetical protein